MYFLPNLVRTMWANNDRKRDKDNKEPDNLTIYKDITYAPSSSNKESFFHLTDIYRPAAGSGLLPVIINVHGGGFFYGDKELYRFYCMHLAAKGFVVVNFNYRLAPEHKYPAAITDVCLLMDFVRNNCEKYGMDPEHLFMVGDSAGAQLITQYNVLTTNRDYRELCIKASFFCPDLLTGNSTDGTGSFKMTALLSNLPVPKAVALNCGVYDTDEIKDQLFFKWYFPKHPSEPLVRSFFDMPGYINSDFPPAYLMASVNDDLKSHTAFMKNRLEKLQVPFCYKEFGEGHPEDGHVFHINLKSQNGLLCNAEECDYFHSHISSY